MWKLTLVSGSTCCTSLFPSKTQNLSFHFSPFLINCTCSHVYRYQTFWSREQMKCKV